MDPLSRIHLNGLRAADAVGRLGTLARAAAWLGVSAGAVSQQIVKTERQLGRPLFERTPKGLVPTAFGRVFLAEIRDGFDRLSGAVALAAEGAAENSLRVSVPPIFASKWLVPRIGGFTAGRPQLAIGVEATVDFADLDAGDVDVAVRVGSGAWPGVRLLKLADLLVFPVTTPADAGRIRAPADVALLPVVRDRHSRIRWSAWLAPLGLGEEILRPGPVFSDSALCLEAAAAGQGVMLAWQTLAHDALAAGRVVAPMPLLAESGFAYWFVTSRRRPPRPVEIAFRDWLVAEMAAFEKEAFRAFLVETASRSRDAAGKGA